MAKGWGSIRSTSGPTVPGATVKVYLAGTSTLASIFSDAALSVAIDQTNSPVTTDDDGTYEFYVATGTYKIVGTKGTLTFTEDNVDIGYSVSAVDPPLTLTGETVGFDAFFDVRAYGATGVGSATDDRAAVQAAIDAAKAAGGGVVFFPVPTADWRIKSDLVIDSDNVTLAGTGWGSYVILEGAKIHVNGTADQISGVNIRDLRIRRLNTNPGPAVDLEGGGSGLQPVRATLSRLDIQGGGGASGSRVGTCIRLAGVAIVAVEQCFLHDTQIGILIQNDTVATTIPPTEITVLGGDITDCDTGVSATNPRGLRLVGHTVQLCDVAGVDILGTSRTVGFYGCRWEDNSGLDLRVGNTSAGCTGVVVDGCQFLDGSAGKDHAITLVRAKGVKVSGNVFVGYAAEAIDIQEASAGDVTGSSYDNEEDGTGIVDLNGCRSWGQVADLFVGRGNPAAGATQYASPIAVEAVSENSITVPAPFTGYARTLRVEKNAAAGAGESLTVTFRVANADTALTAAVSGASATTAEDVTNIAEFTKNDRLSMEFTASNNGSYSANQSRAACELVRLEP